MIFRAFLRKDWAQQASYRLDLVWHLGGLAFFSLLLFFLSGALPGFGGGTALPGYFAFAIVGYALADALWACLKAFSGAIRHEQVVGTLEAMMATATPLWQLLLAAGVYPLCYALVRLALMLGLAAALGAGFGLGQIALVLPLLLLSLLVFAALGLLSATMMLIFKQGDPVAAVIGAVSFLCSGTIYPVSALPDWLVPVSRILPLTYAIDGARAVLLDGGSVGALVAPMVVLTGFLVGTSVLAALSIRLAHKVVLTNGVRQY
jgi:ABC-2 type transport system permease protein